MIETFPLNTPILKTNAVNLKIMFRNRFIYYTKQNPKEIGNKETWYDCYDELMRLNSAFDGKYMSMTENLSWR